MLYQLPRQSGFQHVDHLNHHLDHHLDHHLRHQLEHHLDHHLDLVSFVLSPQKSLSCGSSITCWHICFFLGFYEKSKRTGGS